MLEEFPMLYLRASLARDRFKSFSDSYPVIANRYNQLRAKYLDQVSKFISEQWLDDCPSETTATDEEPLFAREIAQAATALLLTDDQHNVYHVIFDVVERTLIRQVLEHFQGNTVKAATALGITRNRLRRRMQALRMTLAVEIRMPCAGTR